MSANTTSNVNAVVSTSSNYTDLPYTEENLFGIGLGEMVAAQYGRQLSRTYKDAKQDGKRITEFLIATCPSWPVGVTVSFARTEANRKEVGDRVHLIAKGIYATLAGWKRALNAWQSTQCVDNEKQAGSSEGGAPETAEQKAACMSEEQFLQNLATLQAYATQKGWADVSDSLLKAAAATIVNMQ